MLKFLSLIALVISLAFMQPGMAIVRGLHGSGIGPTSSCTTNGSDGQAAAPAGAGQFPTLLTSYATRPTSCVAGADFAVAMTPNATVSGNTITETSNANVPVNGDQKSFYPQQGGSLPSGITKGAAAFICNVTNITGSTYSYTLAPTGACSSTITLGALATSFIALKLPEGTTNTPTGTSNWGGGSGCASGTTFSVCVTGNNATIDHFDFSANGGWLVVLNTVDAPTVTNNYWLIGSNLMCCIQDQSGGPATNVTFKYNEVDGNAVAVYTTASGGASSGATSITVASAAGITNRMTFCDVTTQSATNCPSILVTNIVGNTLTIAPGLSGALLNGDTLAFANVPGTGSSGTPGSLYQNPQVVLISNTTLTMEYNWIRNTFAIHVSHGISGATSTGTTVKYNLFENAGWGTPLSSTIHGDVFQLFGLSGSYGALVYDYNTVIQNTALAKSDSTTFSLLISGQFGATASTLDFSNNVGIYSVGGSVLTSTYGLGAVNPGWYTGAITVQNNYVDPTSASNGSTFGASVWSEVNLSAGGGTGPNSPTCTATGNINLVTGSALPKPFGSYC